MTFLAGTGLRVDVFFVLEFWQAASMLVYV